jgi:hydroxyethylthiazole kinase
MSHAPDDAGELAAMAGAVVLNIGTPENSYAESMVKAARAAASHGVPVVLDPVAIGVTRLRTEIVRKVLDAAPVAVVRGNASEIMAMAGLDAVSKGADSAHDADDALDALQSLAKSLGCVTCVSGARDTLTDGKRTIRLSGGHAMMPKVTGLGCTATALIGAFCAVNDNYLEAAAHAMAVMNTAGAIAGQNAPGPGSLQYLLYDALYGLTAEQVQDHMQWEEM